MLRRDVQPARLFVFQMADGMCACVPPYCPEIKPLECVAQAAQMLYKTRCCFCHFNREIKSDHANEKY